MSYLEKKRTHDKIYISFVKKVSFMNKPFIIKKHIGVDFSTITKERFLLDNLDSISGEEANFRKPFLKKILNITSHNKKLPEKIDIKSIKINNFIEGKNCKKNIFVEFAKEFIFNSNNIEGSKIPPEKVREIIDTGDTKYKNRNEVKEVKNSILALEYLKKSFKFNLSSIKRLYYILTKDLIMNGGELYPKGFKKIQNVVGNSQTTEPDKVEEELEKLIKWYSENKGKLHPLVLAFEFHKKYEFIHPFLDGNGRTGRFIMNKILMSQGYFPMIVYKTNKISYFNAIEKSKDGNSKKYYQFMLEQQNKSYDFILETIKKY